MTRHRFAAMECTTKYKLMMTHTMFTRTASKKDIGVIFKNLKIGRMLTVLIPLRTNTKRININKIIAINHQPQEL